MRNCRPFEWLNRDVNSNTLVHTQLVAFKDDEYASKVATSDEACKLVEAGFEHVCDMNGTHIFRKRK